MVSLTSLAGPHQRGPQGPQRAAGESQRGHQRQQQPGREAGEAQRAGGREPGAHIKLPLPADIDEPDAARKRHRDRRHQERGHPDQQLGEAVGVAEDIDDRIAIGADRILAVDDEHQRECGERDRRDDERRAARGAGPRARSGRCSGSASSRGIGGSDHAEADDLGMERLRRKFARDAPVAQHDQPVADAEEFVEILRDQQHRSARRARVAKRGPRGLGAAGVETAGRIKRRR